MDKNPLTVNLRRDEMLKKVMKRSRKRWYRKSTRIKRSRKRWYRKSTRMKRSRKRWYRKSTRMKRSHDREGDKVHHRPPTRGQCTGTVLYSIL
jgi:hypothetical protein